jgi:hypothetical protein
MGELAYASVERIFILGRTILRIDQFISKRSVPITKYEVVKHL